MALEVQPAHDPVREYGFLGVVADAGTWKARFEHGSQRRQVPHREDRQRFRPGRAPKDQLPPLLQGFGAVPPLVTDVDLSMDDRSLYVACWEPVRCASMTSPTEEAEAPGSVPRRWRGPPHRHPSGKAYAGSPPDRLRSAVMASGSTGPTRSLRRGQQIYPDGVPGAEVLAIASPRRRPGVGKGLLGELPLTDAGHIRSGSRAAIARPDSFCYPSA